MSKKVAIIGGGISGISAAIELINNKIDVDIYEAKSNLGGRVYSLKHNQSGEVIDNGQHIMVGAYDRFFEILRKIGTYDKLYSQKALKIIFYNENNERFELDSSRFPGKLGLLYGLLNMKCLNFKDKFYYIYLYLRLSLNLFNNEGSAATFLKSMKQTENLIKIFWEPLIVATLNTSLEKASAKLLINILKLSFFSQTEKAKIFIPSCDFSDLIDPFVNWMKKSGGNVNFNCLIKNIEFSENEIDYLVDSNGNIIKADYYIFALPFGRINNLFGNRNIFLNKDFNFDIFRSSPITSIYLWFDQKFFPEDFAAVIGKRIQWIFNRNIIFENKFDDGIERLTITISDSGFLDDLNQENLIQLCLSELGEIFPASKHSKLLYSKVIKEKNATFLADCMTENIRPDNSTLFNNLFIAGDWTNTNLPATIEGAAVSGKKAADLLLKKFY